MTSQPPSAGTARTLEEELLRTLARQTRRVPIPVFLAAVMIAALAAQKLPVAAWGGWLLMVAIVLVVRRTLLWRLPRMQGYSDREKLRIAILLNVAMGVVYGLSLLFFPFLPEFERAIQSMILVGLCAGAVATNVGYMPVLSGFLVPTIVPLVLLWALSPGVAEPGWVERSTAVLIALCSAILIPLARDAFRLFRESFEMRLEQAALNQKLQAALERAEEANRAKTRFLAAASHDLRQPIHTLSLFGAALAMCNLDARTREISQNINVALQGMASQFDALLDISKLDAGVVHVDRAPLEPRRLVERLAHEFAPVAAAKGLEMTASCTFDGVVQTDRLLLERIMRNLTDNAIKYTDAGSVRLGVARSGDDVVLAVADTGRGIPASEHARVFEEFYQLDNPERDRTRGFGLGLSIVKRLADLLGIRLDMESAPGAGTTFRLRLAVAPGDAATAALPAAAASRLNGLHVLVVDDERQVRLGMKTLLEGMGCRATLVDGTQRALAAAELDRPDIVVADFRLRGEDDGIAAVHSLRALYPELPAILLSGDTAPDRLREAEAAGIALLHKPVAVADLAQAIARARRAARGIRIMTGDRSKKIDGAAPTAWISRGFEELVASRDAEPTTSTVDFDVVIVGSGYGGAIAAARLAGATKNGEPVTVCVLERGREYLPGMFPPGLSDLAGHVRFSTDGAACARGEREGLFDVRVGADVSAVVANGLGGGSLINAGVMAEPHDDVFLRPEWPLSDPAGIAGVAAQALRESANAARCGDRGRRQDGRQHGDAERAQDSSEIPRAREDGGLAEGVEAVHSRRDHRGADAESPVVGRRRARRVHSLRRLRDRLQSRRQGFPRRQPAAHGGRRGGDDLHRSDGAAARQAPRRRQTPCAQRPMAPTPGSSRSPTPMPTFAPARAACSGWSRAR